MDESNSKIKRLQEPMNSASIFLEGDHIQLEPLASSHAKPLADLAAEGELFKSSVTVIPGQETAEAYVEEALNEQSEGRQLPFVIVDRETGILCGTTRYRNMSPQNATVEIGNTWLGKRWQRTVVNTEAKLLMLTHAFEWWGCVRVEFLTDALNEQSRKAISRLGARQEGVLRNHLIMPNGRVRDSVVFSIVREEWPEVKERLKGFLTRI